MTPSYFSHAPFPPSPNRLEKSRQLLLIKPPIRSYSAAHVHRVGAHDIDRLPDIFRPQPSSQEHRNLNAFTDLAADLPIVNATGASKLFHYQGRVTGIKQQRIHTPCNRRSFFYRSLISHVDDLNDANP